MLKSTYRWCGGLPSANTVGHINIVTLQSTSSPVSTAMGQHLWACNQSLMHTQPPTLSGTGNFFKY